MKLLLTSGGLTNFAISQVLEELTGGSLEEKNLAFIPTAATITGNDKKWLIRDFVNCRRLGFKEIDIVDISAISKDLWLPRLQQADILLFGGGNTAHLLYWIKKSGLQELLPSLLETKVYVGISAGSIAATHSIALSSPENKEFAKTIGEYSGEEGLGLVQFHVRPHLNSLKFPSITIPNIQKIAETLKEPVYAIDDDTAIVVNNSVVTVVSEGKWQKFN